jgi:hypothetical protein
MEVRRAAPEGGPSIIEPGLLPTANQAATSIETKIQVAEASPGA